MADTKKLDPKARRKAKRDARRENKKIFQAMSLEQKKKLRKYEGTFKQFLAEQKQAAAQEG